MDDAGRTTLHHAAETRFEGEQVVARLLDAGAPIEVRDSEGRTALCTAQAVRNRPVVEVLETQGAQPQSCAPPQRSYPTLIRLPKRR